MASRGFLPAIFDRFRRKPAPTSTVGTSGTAIYGGFIQEKEKDASLTGHQRYTTFSDMLANISVVAAGVRYFLNLVADAEWRVQPAEDMEDGEVSEKSQEYADKIKAMMGDMHTPWHRVVRRAAMYRFYGFSIQEWTAGRNDDGDINFADVAPRPQLTVWRWDVDTVTCHVNGVTQRIPDTGTEVYLPREKIIYMVDDSLNDSPEGLGLFRHLVEPANRLKQYQQFEFVGYETDLRGVPIGRVPYGLLNRLVSEGKMSKEDAKRIVKPVEDFVQGHVRTSALGLTLDSAPYTGQDEAATPSRIQQWEMELMRGEGAAQALKEMGSAIDRLQREIARVLGVEQFLLGGGERGSFALAKDKTQAFLLMVNATLNEIVKQFEKDFVERIFELNGWDMKLKPTLIAGERAVP